MTPKEKPHELKGKPFCMRLAYPSVCDGQSGNGGSGLHPDYADLRGDPGGKEHCVWRAFKEAPLSITTRLCEGGAGAAPSLRTKRDRG